MTLEQLIEIADRAYGENLIRAYHDEPDVKHGDTLAQFIAIELGETFEPLADDVEQLREAERVIGSARRQLEDVEDAFLAAEHNIA